MCPFDYALVEILLAWNMNHATWDEIHLCAHPETHLGEVVDVNTSDIVNIGRVTIGGKTFWVVEDYANE